MMRRTAFGYLLAALLFVAGYGLGARDALHTVRGWCDESGGFKFRGKIYTCQPEPVRKVPQGVVL